MSSSQADIFQKIEFTEDEKKFTKKHFRDIGKILNHELKCTVCQINISWMVFLKKEVLVHPILQVMVCEGCLINVNVCKSSPELCIWCGTNKGNDLLPCKSCPASFCSKCVINNFGEAGCLEIKNCGWDCILCDSKKIWILRSVCTAAIEMSKALETGEDKDNNASDTFTSCSICMADFDKIRTLPCRHKFHQDCLNNWLTRSRSCPICRGTYASVA